MLVKKPSNIQHLRKQKYVLYGKTQQNGMRKKIRIFEPPHPNKLLQATAYPQDEVLRKIADLEEENSLLDADLHYHKNWQVAQVIYFCDTTLLIIL